MHCWKFKSQHVAFIDDVLPAADMMEMRRHIDACSRCGTLDVRIRRSLLVVRNLPQIEPSPDFFARLNEQLKAGPIPVSRRSARLRSTTVVLATAAVAAALYFAMAVGVGRSTPYPSSGLQTATAAMSSAPSPIADPALAAAVPAGIPVWPAMFMVGELPMHLTNAELLDNGISR